MAVDKVFNFGNAFEFRKGDDVCVEIREEAYQLIKGPLKDVWKDPNDATSWDLQVGNCHFEYDAKDPNTTIWKDEDQGAN